MVLNRVFNDPACALDMWYKIYDNIVDIHIPIREKRVKSISLPQWLSRDLLASIRTRNGLKRSAKNSQQWSEYKRFRNLVTYQIRSAKKNYYSEQIENNRQDSNKLWEVLKNAAGISKKGNLPSNIIQEGMSLVDKHEIANAFNLHFCSAAAKVHAESNSRVLHADTRLEAIIPVSKFVSKLYSSVPFLASIPAMSERFLAIPTIKQKVSMQSTSNY